MRHRQGRSHGKEPHTTAVAGKGRGRANSNKIYAKLLANSAFERGRQDLEETPK